MVVDTCHSYDCVDCSTGLYVSGWVGKIAVLLESLDYSRDNGLEQRISVSR